MAENDQIQKAGIGSHVRIRLANQKKLEGKIVKMSCCEMVLFMDMEDMKQEDLASVKIEISKENQSIFADGLWKGFRESAEMEGFGFITYEIKYSFSLVDALITLYEFIDRVGPDGLRGMA